MPVEKSAESRFWDRYIEILKQAGVPEPARRWYVVRVERYIAAHSTLRLRLHTPVNLEAYLTEAGRDASLYPECLQASYEMYRLRMPELKFRPTRM